MKGVSGASLGKREGRHRVCWNSPVSDRGGGEGGLMAKEGNRQGGGIVNFTSLRIRGRRATGGKAGQGEEHCRVMGIDPQLLSHILEIELTAACLVASFLATFNSW